jgi:hypothetical protein
MTALAKDPKSRFGSMRALATALEQASLLVQDVPSVQLNNGVLLTSQDVTSAPVSPPQSALESPQAELEQVKPLLKAPEPLRGNGEAQGEVPPQGHADSSSHHTDESASLDETADQDEKVNPWGIGERQIIAMFIGIVMYSVVDLLADALIVSATNGQLNMILATILFGLTFVVPLFFATKFGPWVGLVVALLGWLIGDFLASSIAKFVLPFPWYSYASVALLGFLAGLAFLRTRGRYNTRGAITTAVVTSSIGLVVSDLLLVISDRIANPSSWINDLQWILADIVALILLPILLIIYDKIERRNIPTG